jgi:EAL domain-containing protein (putative c-di-GMP-specific phosphodiesterase class I)
LGVGLVADHVGTGAISLRLLASAPLAAIKLDAALVREIGQSRLREAIIAAVVAIATARAIPVTACGIETEEERVALASLGVRAGQGPLFAALPWAA